jgi:hypothetical protein
VTRRRRWLPLLASLAVFVLAVGLRFAVWSRPPAELDHLTLIDDTYLALHLSRSIAAGLGPFYGLAPTNGFQPLYVFALVPAFRLWPHDPDLPIRAALALLALFDLATLLLLGRLVRRTTRSPWAPVVAMLVWAVNPYVLRTAFNGLETAIACFMLLVLLSLLDAFRRRGSAPTFAQAAGFGAVLGLAGLARIDLLLFSIPAAWTLLVRGRRAGAPHPRIAGLAVIAGIGALAVTLPWLVYSWHWTGTLFPVSGRAVRYMELSNVGHAPTWSSLYAPMLTAAIETAARWNAVLLAGLGLMAAACLVTEPGAAFVRLRRSAQRVGRALEPALPGLAFALLLGVAYAFVIFGRWHFPRYLFPLALPLTWSFALLLDETLQPRWAERDTSRPARGGSRAAGWAVVVLVVAGLALEPPFGRLFAPLHGAWGYRPIGEWARRAFPAGTRIGASQSGALGYFADSLVVVNLDGVVNRGAYDATRAGRALDYVRESGIRQLVWQDDVAFLVRETHGATMAEIRLEAVVPGIRTWGTGWNVYRVLDPGTQSASSIGPPGAGPSAASEKRAGTRNVRAASITSSRVTAITRATSSSIVQKRPR